jgi:hypothetical protein
MYKIKNKERRGERGPKKRYSVFRAELRPKIEEEDREFMERVRDKKGIPIEKFFPHDSRDKNFWAKAASNYFHERYPQDFPERHP